MGGEVKAWGGEVWEERGGEVKAWGGEVWEER